MFDVLDIMVYVSLLFCNIYIKKKYLSVYISVIGFQI